MRLALWTAQPERWQLLPSGLATSFELVDEHAPPRPPADLEVYHLRDDPAFAFVLRAAERQPGLVVLEDWVLHGLVHAATAGRGDEAGYLRAARRSGGARGEFVARQVLRGRGGALVSLLPLNERVLDGALALIVADAALRARAAPLLRGRPLLVLSLEADGAAAVAAAAAALAQRLAPLRADVERELAALRAEEETALGRARDELRPLARELGLSSLPAAVERALASLLQPPGAQGAGAGST